MKLAMIAAIALIPALSVGGESEPSHKAWNAQEEATDKKYADKVKAGMTKPERVAWVKGLLVSQKDRIRSAQEELALARKAKDAERIKGAESVEAHALARRDHWQFELDWLEGRITAKTAEAKVKAAEEAVKKAEEAKADEKTLAPLKAAVDVAKKEDAAVKVLEAGGEF